MIEPFGYDFVTPDEGDEAMHVEFDRITKDIRELPEFQKLMGHTHHHASSRYQHCVNVAWYSYQAAKKAGLDYVSCTRGALLHDFYLYDRHGKLPLPGSHDQVHPQIALANAKRFFTINRIEADCILCHMWPSGGQGRPKTPEGRIVSRMDKYCAVMEFASYRAKNVEQFVNHTWRTIFNR